MKKYLKKHWGISSLAVLAMLGFLIFSAFPSQSQVWSKYFPGNILVGGDLLVKTQIQAQGASPFELEGETKDGNETTIAITDPTADRTITLQDASGTVYLSSGTDVVVADGGTGVSTLTDHGIILGSGTDPVTILGAATNGQLPIGSTGADPVLGTLTGTANEITVTNTAGSIALDIPDAVTLATLTLTNDLTVPNGGTGVGTLTDHGVLLGSNADAITPLGVATNGQLVIGSTAADPVLAALTGTANEITVTNTAGSIALDIPDAVTLSTLTLTNDLTVENGGTGAGTFTDHGILLGSGTTAVTPLGEAANGYLPIGSTGADPVLAALTGTALEIEVANTAGAITLGIPDAVTLATLTLTNDLTVANGGSGASTFTDHGVLLGADATAFSATAVGTDGQMFLGVSTADPGWQTMGGDGLLGADGTLAIQDDAIARTNLIEDSLAVYGIPLGTVKNSDGTSLAAAAGAGVFGINTGGFGTGTLTLDGEAASGNSKTDTCWFEFVLPPGYISDQDVNLVLTAKESVGAATPSTTLSAEVYESDGEGAVSANIYNAFDVTDVTASWQTCTSMITDTDLVAGDRLVVFIRIITDDTSGTAGTVAQIGKIELRLDIKG